LIGICYHCNRLKDTREIGKYELCEEHQNLKQYQPKVKKTSIPKMSKKMKRQISEYSKVRAEFLEENPNCQFKGCNKKADSIHHIKGRGIYLLKKETFMAVCHHHHVIIEHNPEWSYEHGYSLSRLNKQ